MPERSADWFEAFGQEVRTAVTIAQGAARAFGHNYVGSEHLLIGVIEVDGPARDALVRELSSAEARLAVEEIVGRGLPPASDQPGLTPRARASLEWAHEIASTSGSAAVEPVHLMIALLELDPDAMASAVLGAVGVDRRRLRGRLVQLLENEST